MINCHETGLEMSHRPLGTTVFEEIYIRTMGKYSYSSEIHLRSVYSHFYDHVDHHIFQLITAFHLFYDRIYMTFDFPLDPLEAEGLHDLLSFVVNP